jgi:hypothetical protein
MNKKELIEQLNTVKSVAPAFLSIDDVIEMVEGLETSSDNISGERITDLISDITSTIVGMGMDLINDYELTMSGREVEIDYITVDEDEIEKEVTDVINSYFKD